MIMFPEKFIEQACKRVGFALDEVRGKKRRTDINEFRYALYYILRNNFNLSYPSIGDILHRDHTGVMSALKLYEPDMTLINMLLEEEQEQDGSTADYEQRIADLEAEVTWLKTVVTAALQLRPHA